MFLLHETMYIISDFASFLLNTGDIFFLKTPQMKQFETEKISPGWLGTLIYCVAAVLGGFMPNKQRNIFASLVEANMNLPASVHDFSKALVTELEQMPVARRVEAVLAALSMLRLIRSECNICVSPYVSLIVLTCM